MSAQIPFSVVTKPTGAACNLDCQYCFFLSKELLYDAAAQTMSEETLERYVQSFLESSPDGEVTMLWQGGEPTLRGLGFFERLVELCERYRRPTQRVRHALQTNGTLVSDEWARFFADHEFLVGVSIDGPAHMHDAYRLNRGGRGTHAMVVRGWEALARTGVETNILCTVNAANEEHGAQVYRYFRDELGTRYLQFIPIVERVRAADLAQAERGWRSGTSALLYRQDGDCVTSRSTSPASYGRFLCEVFDQWLASDVGEVFIQDVDSTLSAMFGSASVCVHAPVCGANMAMEFNGDVYACDHWVEPDWLVGSITSSPLSQLAASDKMRDFARLKPDLDEECRVCVPAPVLGRVSERPFRAPGRARAQLPVRGLPRLLRARHPRPARHRHAHRGGQAGQRRHGPRARGLPGGPMILHALLIGALVGVVVGSLGAGGGIVSVPILVYVLGQDPHQATGLSLIIVAASTLAATLA